MGIVHPDCKISTSIAEFLTFGTGKLDSDGFWQYPCYECARAHEEKFPEDFPCWPFSTEWLNERKANKKWPFNGKEEKNEPEKRTQ
jgi:hypothetical protein